MNAYVSRANCLSKAHHFLFLHDEPGGSLAVRAGSLERRALAWPPSKALCLAKDPSDGPGYAIVCGPVLPEEPEAWRQTVRVILFPRPTVASRTFMRLCLRTSDNLSLVSVLIFPNQTEVQLVPVLSFHQFTSKATWLDNHSQRGL